MTEALKFFVQCFKDIVAVLNSTSFVLYEYEVSLGAVLMVFVALGAIISIFWKGAKG